MPEVGVLAAFCLACLVISLVPGPDMFFITATGLASGPRNGVVAALGMSLGMAVHTTAAALGLSALISEAPVAYDVIRWGGVVYLVYLAFMAFREAGKISALPADEPQPARSSGRILTMAFMTNLANPKVIAFYLAFIPQFVDPGRGNPTLQFFVLGAILIAIGLSVDASAGLLAGRFGNLLRSRPGIQRWLHRVAGGVFAALAVRLAADS